MASVRNQQNRLWDRLKILYSVLGYFLSFSVLLFLAAFVSALITLFGAFESYFNGLGSTVTHKNFLAFVTQKLPKNREFLAWDLFCNIDMELVTGLEPATCSLRMSCTTNCATQALLNFWICKGAAQLSLYFQSETCSLRMSCTTNCATQAY